MVFCHSLLQRFKMYQNYYLMKIAFIIFTVFEFGSRNIKMTMIDGKINKNYCKKQMNCLNEYISAQIIDSVKQLQFKVMTDWIWCRDVQNY